MTLMESAELLGNFGEFFGAIAVVTTLGYLVVQIKQNTKMLNSTIYSSWVETASKSMLLTADHAEAFGAIYTEPPRALRDLNPTERQLHGSVFTHNMNLYESCYLNYLDGAIDEMMFDAKRRNLLRIFRPGLYRESWTERAHDLYDVRFIEYVENHILPES